MTFTLDYRPQLKWYREQRRKRLMRRQIKHDVQVMLVMADAILRCPDCARATLAFERRCADAATCADVDVVRVICDQRSQFFGARCEVCSVIVRYAD